MLAKVFRGLMMAVVRAFGITLLIITRNNLAVRPDTRTTVVLNLT